MSYPQNPSGQPGHGGQSEGSYGAPQQGGHGQYGGQQGQPPAYGSQPPTYGGAGQPPVYGGGAGQPPSYGGGSFGGGSGQPPYGGQSPYGSSDPSEKSFFAKLFDFSFKSYVTPSIIKIVYVLIMVFIVVAWLGYTIFGFSHSAGAGIGIFIAGAIVALLYLIFARMTLEFYSAVIRIAEDVSDLKHRREGVR